MLFPRLHLSLSEYTIFLCETIAFKTESIRFFINSTETKLNDINAIKVQRRNR